MSEIESYIRSCRHDLDQWLTSSYTGREALKFYGENDASYPQWRTIEEVVGWVFDTQSVQQLDTDSQDAILFFISRSDEIGCIICWLNTERESSLSDCGYLSESDFLFLCDESLVRGEDYSDYQLASCFEKFTILKPEYERVLLRFFTRKHSYTRRRSLHSLARLNFPGIIDLATNLWGSDDCEFAKLSCLYTLKDAAGGRQMFEEFLAEFEATHDVSKSTYLPAHLERLKADKG